MVPMGTIGSGFYKAGKVDWVGRRMNNEGNERKSEGAEATRRTRSEGRACEW